MCKEITEKSDKNIETCHRCTAGIDKMEIMWDGIVIPCPAFKGLRRWYALGDVHKESLETIYPRGRTHRLLNVGKVLLGITPGMPTEVTDEDIEQLNTITKTVRDEWNIGYEVEGEPWKKFCV